VTRKSRREIERALNAMGDGPDQLVIRDTVVATSWGDEETDPGTVLEEKRTEIEL
jgi:hypothetical protein